MQRRPSHPAPSGRRHTWIAPTSLSCCAGPLYRTDSLSLPTWARERGEGRLAQADAGGGGRRAATAAAADWKPCRSPRASRHVSGCRNQPGNAPETPGAPTDLQEGQAAGVQLRGQRLRGPRAGHGGRSLCRRSGGLQGTTRDCWKGLKQWQRSLGSLARAQRSASLDRRAVHGQGLRRHDESPRRHAQHRHRRTSQSPARPAACMMP